MKITRNNVNYFTRKFLQGGPMEAPAEVGGAPEEGTPEESAPEGAPEGGEEDPIGQLVQIFSQGLQNQDCQALAQGAQMFLLFVQQSQGGSPQEQLGEPVYRKGGILAYRIKK